MRPNHLFCSQHTTAHLDPVRHQIDILLLRPLTSLLNDSAKRPMSPSREEKAPKVANHPSFHDSFNLSWSNKQPSPQAHRVANPPLPISNNMTSNPEEPSSPAHRITDHPPIPITSGTSHTELYFRLPCEITNPHLFATSINYITEIGLNGHDVSQLTKVIQSIRSDDGLLFISIFSRLELATLVSVINRASKVCELVEWHLSNPPRFLPLLC